MAAFTFERPTSPCSLCRTMACIERAAWEHARYSVTAIWQLLDINHRFAPWASGLAAIGAGVPERAALRGVEAASRHWRWRAAGVTPALERPCAYSPTRQKRKRPGI